MALAAIQKNYNGVGTFTSNPANLQSGIERARNTRASQINADAKSLDEVQVD